MSRKMHIVPTHLRVPETLLTIAGLNFSVRQFLLLLLGGAMGYDLWLHIGNAGSFASAAGQIARLVLALLPVVLATAFAFTRLAGRTLDRWFLLLLLYLGRPRRFVWRSIRYQEPDAFVLMADPEADDDDKD